MSTSWMISLLNLSLWSRVTHAGRSKIAFQDPPTTHLLNHTPSTGITPPPPGTTTLSAGTSLQFPCCLSYRPRPSRLSHSLFSCWGLGDSCTTWTTEKSLPLVTRGEGHHCATATRHYILSIFIFVLKTANGYWLKKSKNHYIIKKCTR